jgi:hypothetical protein
MDTAKSGYVNVPEQAAAKLYVRVKKVTSSVVETLNWTAVPCMVP